MSRKHNCPKRGRRSKSHYKDRLARRGLRSADVAMEDADTLRARQERQPRGGFRPANPFEFHLLSECEDQSTCLIHPSGARREAAGIADEVAWDAPRPLTGRRP